MFFEHKKKYQFRVTYNLNRAKMYFLICTLTLVVYVGGTPQFYYMVPTIQQPSPYYTSFGPNPPIPVQSPATSFISQTSGPLSSYVTHQTFGILNNNPGFQPYTGQAQQTQFTGQVQTNTIISTGPTDKYRGFAYHTQLTNGASSNVFFLTGPEAHQIQQLTNLFNDTRARINEKAKTLASDSVDSNAVDKSQKEQIQATLTGAAPPTFDTIRSFLENSQVNFHQFYSSNGQLFTQTNRDPRLNLPASTVLLPAPISIQSFGNIPYSLPTQLRNATSNATGEEKQEKENTTDGSVNNKIDVSNTTVIEKRSKDRKAFIIETRSVKARDFKRNKKTEQATKGSGEMTKQPDEVIEHDETTKQNDKPDVANNKPEDVTTKTDTITNKTDEIKTTNSENSTPSLKKRA